MDSDESDVSDDRFRRKAVIKCRHPLGASALTNRSNDPSGFLTSRSPRRRMACQTSFRDPSRRTAYADSHFVVPKVDAIAKIEGGRVSESYHLSIATDQFRSELVRR